VTQLAGDIAAFSHDVYVFRRKVFALLGAKFHVYDAAGNLVMYSKLKAFKLKEDVRLFTGEDMQTELLSIKARKILDFSSAYDVVDSRTQAKVGVLKRKGLKSLIQDEWIIANPQDVQIGMIQEESTGLALLRRFVDFVSFFFPQQFNVTINGQQVATFKQNYNPFVQKLTVRFEKGSEAMLDRRLGLAAAVIVLAIEGKQR
jgi:uncharacterized protein YxjI